MICEVDLYVEHDELDLCVESPIIVEGTDVPVYEGPVRVTPTREEQVLLTGGFRLLENITVEPIPSNYGLITWNGSALTVS